MTPTPKYLTTAQMREADRRAIEVIGIPGPVLMNNAGAAVFTKVTGPKVGVVCGKGNNGGDGYVVARLALLAGYDTRVIVLAERESIQGDAAIFMHAYENLGGPIQFINNEDDAKAATESLSDCTTLVDAILGTGITGEVRGLAAIAINLWPTNPRTIAVDIPSGMNADTGEPCGGCIRADATVTFQFPKAGFENPGAQEYIGDLTIADIGIPEICGDDEAWQKRFE